MNIIDENYETFLNKEILLLSSYIDSAKRISFSFRNGIENQDVLAYVSLKEDSNTTFDGHGLRITEIKNIDTLADERFFDRIKTILNCWVDKSGLRQFDYLWFSTDDISKEYSIRLCEYIGFVYDKSQGLYVCYADTEITTL